MLQTTFSNQLIGKRAAFRYIAAHQFLRTLDSLTRGKDTYFSILKPQNYLIPNLQSQSLTILGRNDNPTTFSKFCSYFEHMTPYFLSTIFLCI